MSAHQELHLTDAQLSDYTDGVLDAATRPDVERHLASCQLCRNAIRETREVIEVAQRSRPNITAPAELWPLVASSTIHLAAVRRQVLASMRGVLIVGAIALVAATAVVTWNVARWTSAPRTNAPTAGTPVTARDYGHPARLAPQGSHPPQAPHPPAAPRP